MSGIYGIIQHDGTPVSTGKLNRIAAAMAFWGRDGGGQWKADSAGLGHLMLRTTPESLQERMPASIRPAPHLVITADARIDNRTELFDALGVQKHGRAETPDSSLILLAYERWGPECVRKLLGDFAIAIWDTRERQLFCARDPSGCKPFVYSYEDRRFVFASEVNGVRAVLESPHLNELLIAATLQLRTYYAEKTLTFFKEIVKLPPAHSMMVTSTGIRLTKYWSPEDAPEIRFARDDEYAERLSELVEASIACRTRSAYPIASHLSGGLDSSVVTIAAARANRSNGSPLAVFSWSPPPDPQAELKSTEEYIRIGAVCRQEGLICQFVPPTDATLRAQFSVDPTVEPFVMLARETNVQIQAEKQGCRVILSGWGGDEAVSMRSINLLAEYLSSHQWKALIDGLRARTASGEGLGSKALQLGKAFYGLGRTYLPGFAYRMIAGDIYPGYEPVCTQLDFARRFKRAVGELYGPPFRHLPGARATIRNRLEIGSHTMRMEHWGCSGARRGIEYRYPMLDRRLIEFSLGVPTRQFGLPGEAAFLRRAVGALLPVSVDWSYAKSERATFPAFRRDNLRAHVEYSSQVMSGPRNDFAAQFVSIERLQWAVELVSRPGKLIPLGGISAALRCFSIKEV